MLLFLCAVSLLSFHTVLVAIIARPGNPTSLYDLIISPDVAILQGSGLGGTSLINANVGLDCEMRVFEDEVRTGYHNNY